VARKTWRQCKRLRDSSGFRGLIRLWNSAEAKTLVLTLWADEESLRASAEAGDHLGGLTAQTVGTTRLALEDYEVSLFDSVFARLHVLQTTQEQHDVGLEIVRDQLLPDVADI